MGSTCLVSHQLIGITLGTLSLPIPLGQCYFSSWLLSVNCRVSMLCSFLQSQMGALGALILLLETPGFSSASEYLDTVKSLACARAIRAPRVSARGSSRWR